jgi:hypothetical protein
VRITRDNTLLVDTVDFDMCHFENNQQSPESDGATYAAQFRMDNATSPATAIGGAQVTVKSGRWIVNGSEVNGTKLNRMWLIECGSLTLNDIRLNNYTYPHGAFRDDGVSMASVYQLANYAPYVSGSTPTGFYPVAGAALLFSLVATSRHTFEFEQKNIARYKNDATAAQLYRFDTLGTNRVRGFGGYTAFWDSAGAQGALWDEGSLLIGTGTKTSSAVALEVKSTTKALLLSRMTTTERDAIASPTAGLLIYNTTTNKLNVYTGGAWEAVTSV